MVVKLQLALLLSIMLVWAVASPSVFAQTNIQGRVTNAATHEGIGGATVSLINSAGVAIAGGTSTDSMGFYKLPLVGGATHVVFDALGFETLTIELHPDRLQAMNAALEESFQSLDEVVISGKGRYRNRNNPAVALIKKVIEHKPANRLSRFGHVSVETYEKILMGVTELPRFIAEGRLTQDFRFALQNTDTTLLPGRAVLPIYLQESLSTRYMRSHPQTNKTIVTATKKTELDRRYINNYNIETYFKFIHGDVDIYEDNILILNKPFLGPTAEAAPLFYKFFITDTVSSGDGTFVELAFVPRNHEDRLFSGKLQIALDGTYGVRRADIWIDHRANLDWVNSVTVSLRFSRHPSGIHLLTYSDMELDFGLHQRKRGAYGRRTLIYQNYDTQTTIPSEVFTGQLWVKHPDAAHRTEDHWRQNRPLQLSDAEAKTYINMDSLQRNRAFRRTIRLGYMLAQGFVPAGPVEFGPFEYSYSFNDLEGNRLRLGGRTTPLLSQRLYAEAYTAYGFRDERFKFYGGLAQSLNRRQIGVYPANYVQITYHQDAREPGQALGFRNGDSFIRSLRSGAQDNWLYHNTLRFNHVIEFGNHIMLQTSLSSHKQAPAASLHFITAGSRPDTLAALRTTELGFHLRWAPNEEFFQRNLERTPITNEHPVFNLRYNVGFKGFLGGEYNYHALRLDVLKRIFLSQLGLADVTLGAGYIFGTVPYPLLDIPNASQTYVLSADAYSLMNNLEFVSDQYLKLNVEHRMHGFLLNKIPLLKKLKIRELAGFKLLYGGVRPENRPEHNANTLLFPEDRHGSPSTFALGRRPYMEASLGLENILNVLRVEYVRRLSYLHHAGTDKGGIRFSIKIDF